MRISDWSSDVCSSDLHLGTRRAQCGMQHAEQPALLCEKVEWLHAHEGAAKGPGFQATTREDVCNWRRTPSVTIASFPVQRKQRWRSEEHTSELQSIMRSSYAGICLKKKKTKTLNIKRQ